MDRASHRGATTTDDAENVAVDLAQFDDDYAQAECDFGGEAADLPDGRYRMLVNRVELQHSGKGNPMLVWRMRVIGPHHAGALHWHRNMIVSRDNLRWLKKDLLTAGLELQKLSDLPHRLDELVDVLLEIQLKTKGDVQNSYINKRIRTPARAAGPAAAGQTPPDDFPF
jgi:hypothetical protein